MGRKRKDRTAEVMEELYRLIAARPDGVVEALLAGTPPEELSAIAAVKCKRGADGASTTRPMGIYLSLPPQRPRKYRSAARCFLGLGHGGRLGTGRFFAGRRGEQTFSLQDVTPLMCGIVDPS